MFRCGESNDEEAIVETESSGEETKDSTNSSKGESKGDTQSSEGNVAVTKSLETKEMKGSSQSMKAVSSGGATVANKINKGIP